MATPSRQRAALAALADLDQMMAGVRNGDSHAIARTRALMLDIIARCEPEGLAFWLIGLRFVAEHDARRQAPS